MQEGVLLPFPTNMYADPQSFDQVNNEVLDDLFNHAEVTTTLYNLYMRNLYTTMLAGRDIARKIIFVRPQMVFPYGHDIMSPKQGLEISQKLSKYFHQRGTDKNTIFIAPYCEGGHWMLLVINPTLGRVWYLDPIRSGHPSNRPHIVEMINHSRFDTATSWTVVKYPKQANKVKDYGYTVMKFMKDIIQHAPTGILPNDYYEDTYCDTYTHAQMEEVFEELAHGIFKAWFTFNSQQQ
ncbi:uncharacterized protein LOC129311427 [Prosopis cineraria]|uniref:uncharacterized protein LOC129311427 n=1 Tax=Prosopis cineraria TaxID=364024 RepID=UPI00240F293C|nr:uncharacterized protein LOC129311427 [Prosopis cineraria]